MTDLDKKRERRRSETGAFFMRKSEHIFFNRRTIGVFCIFGQAKSLKNSMFSRLFVGGEAGI